MWFIIGLIVGALILGLIWLFRKSNFNLNWYEWIIGLIGLALILFTIQNFFGSLAEMESKAAAMFWLVTGLPGLILLAVTWQLTARRAKKA
ncbi:MULTISPECIES: hypothetical protein [Dehalococcoides]|jgi:uncharacterized membrane protein YhaH (DUF805 family)|uniref:Reductive dehalogenase anchoring protein n=2 Tax=Dehalococcoides mccartyi TaxID=61435 RepID=A0A142VD39_9CHLR|nr:MULTISPECIES: hypothetical protein [Dehalococcoides]AGG07022.1 putative reductive dehalogenase anchoring protein [Dehalococcoides mccartyi DCMB5]AMU87227.1 reductive dehalogenase anchoring protein [Dehalococcoides mccartyi]PKH45597.1 zinc ribbon domain-containing protein [Dehalococcoides mccartyi]RAL68963.1 Tetrachloroethene reductive dehalogenase TceA membrane-bound subunit [Dehalococcoides mccartyi]RAL70147.1 Tetrachloroethene reductive dehalogenase TceA membrane-bound subunit [Dehalococc